jgi:SAM-dependent methyltransferase
MELRIDFRSWDEWKAWRAEHESKFAGWQTSILDSILQFGYEEPVTGRKVLPGEARIDPANLHETISNAELNSRKRALLLEFDCLRQCFPRLQARGARIYAPEALSRTALIFRGFYPYFLGTEYLPDQAARERFYPVQHADLTNLPLQSDQFDLAYSQDVLEHVPNLEQAIHELARILKPGGILISTFPFAASRKYTEFAASIENGEVVHLKPPEYHDDPLDKKGVLVFQIPGWDVLDMCRQAGLSDALMVLHASSTHGIASDGTPGVFVLSAAKTEHTRPVRDWIWPSQSINQLVGVLGLPRSGTTMFTAVLDAHSDIVAIYEPWNATKTHVEPSAINIATVLSEADTQAKRARTAVVKETTADHTYAGYIGALLNAAQPPLSRHLFVILRNPFHCFLSEIEGRQRWWGEVDLKPDMAVFDQWAERVLKSYQQIVKLSNQFPTSFVFYESCVSNQVETFSKVMQQLGMAFSPGQLNISTSADLRKVRGDMSLVENVRDVAVGSVAKRQDSFEVVRKAFEQSACFARITSIAAHFAQFYDAGLVDAHSVEGTAFRAQFEVLVTV